MAELRGCRACLVELQEIVLSDGGTVLFCATCDTMADEPHHAGGARPWPAGMTRKPLKLVIDRPKTPPRIKFRIPGRKSLTA